MHRRHAVTWPASCSIDPARPSRARRHPVRPHRHDRVRFRRAHLRPRDGGWSSGPHRGRPRPEPGTLYVADTVGERRGSSPAITSYGGVRAVSRSRQQRRVASAVDGPGSTPARRSRGAGRAGRSEPSAGPSTSWNGGKREPSSRSTRSAPSVAVRARLDVSGSPPGDRRASAWQSSSHHRAGLFVDDATNTFALPPLPGASPAGPGHPPGPECRPPRPSRSDADGSSARASRTRKAAGSAICAPRG